MSKETEDKPVFDAERVNAKIKTIIIIHNNAIDQAIEVVERDTQKGYPLYAILETLKELKK